MSIFLEIAERVLEEYEIPMSARDIYNTAANNNYFRSNGKTPENTLRARLSENIRKKGKSSIFSRVAANKFALRKWDHLEEYTAKPFAKNRDEEFVVCIPIVTLDLVGRFLGFKRDYLKYLALIKSTSNLVILKRSNANKRPDLKQLTSYVLLKNKYGNYLSYTRGNYSNKNQLLQDVLCIGFGGHVNKDDLFNLFDKDNGGIWNAAIREVREEIKPLLLNDIKIIGVINDDTSFLGLTHFAFVFEAILPDNFSIKDYNTELSINKLKFLTNRDLKDYFHKLEFWSQILSREIYKDADTSVKIIKKKKGIRPPIAIVGGIGSGKSEVSKILSRTTGFKYISTRDLISHLIGIDDFKNNKRDVFQQITYDFINQPNAPQTLAQEIFKECQVVNFNAIIDGIRNLSTFEEFKKLCPQVMLIYIETSRDKAYNFFKARSKRNASIDEFREAISHNVEKEIPFFKHRADVYIFNGDNINNLSNEIKSWLDEK